MSPELPADTLLRYREDGAVCLKRAFDPAWIEALGAAIDADMATP